MTDPLRLLLVFTHPDDGSMGMGATLAKYAAEGVETYRICAMSPCISKSAPWCRHTIEALVL